MHSPHLLDRLPAHDRPHNECNANQRRGGGYSVLSEGKVSDCHGAPTSLQSGVRSETRADHLSVCPAFYHSSRCVLIADRVRLYSSAFCDIPHVDLVGDSTDACALPDDYVGRPSTDSALNAFAQLATIRLGTQRALISLIDSHRQHILAESTPSMPLRHLAELHTPGNLWLGNVSIPRSWGVCEHILGVQPALLNEAQNTVIINDLQQVDKFASRSYVTDAPHARFYAGVALVGPNGAVVGALCVLDDKPRNGLPEEDLLYLRELSTTITEYLGTYSLKDAYRQGEQLTRGLISFTEGAATLQSHRSRSLPSTEPLSSPKPFEILDSPELVSRTHGGVHSTSKVPLLRSQSSDMSQSTQDSTAGRGNSIARMQDRILPLNSKDMFARAANVMRASRELDGVLILDTSVAAAGQRQGGENVDAATEIEGDSSSLSRYSTDREGSHRSEDESPERPQMKRKKCEILAFSTKEGSSVRGDTIEAGLGTLLESDLGQLLRQFPKGKVIHFDAVGERIASTSDSDSSSTSLDKHGVSQERPRRRTSVERSRPKRAMDALRSAFPEARSVAFIPFWDYERSRWFAGCLCWTNNPLRPLIPEIDLIYFKVFGHTIMSELSRLDHAVTAEAKTSFAASVSHELRSPLHGILGTLQFLHGTALDSFQVNMLNSMSACGRTLLDTVDHVLDYSKINDTKRSTSTKTITGERTVRLVAKARKSRMSACSRKKGAAIDLALITEESIEAIFSGQTFNVTVGSGAERATSSMEAGQETIDQDPNAGVAERKGRFVVLDISQLENWQFCVPAGAWRRIVMNIFANALKHTESGSIQVLLRTAEQTSGAATLPRVILTVSDTGSGMSQEFLAHRLFQAFTQENPHLPGTGLGMSIVRQIIETIGGRIDVTSHSEGTQFVVRLALARPQDLPGPLLQGPRSIEPMSNLRGRTVRILHKAYPKLTGDANFDAIAKHRSIFVEALMRTLRTCLKMHVTQTTEWACHGSHIFICPEPSFEYLNEIRARRTAGDKAPITIFIAMDGIEATTLRSDARIMSKESVVEIMTQP